MSFQRWCNFDCQSPYWDLLKDMSTRMVSGGVGWSSLPSLLGTSRLPCCSRTCQLFAFKFPQKNEEDKPLVNNVSPLGRSWGRATEFWYLLQMQKISFDKAALGLTTSPITGGKDPCAVHLMYLLAVFVHIQGNGVQLLWRTGISLASELQVSSAWRNNSFCCVTTKPLDGICNGQAWKSKVMHVGSLGPTGLGLLHWGNRCERHWNLTDLYCGNNTEDGLSLACLQASQLVRFKRT